MHDTKYMGAADERRREMKTSNGKVDELNKQVAQISVHSASPSGTGTGTGTDDINPELKLNEAQSTAFKKKIPPSRQAKEDYEPPSFTFWGISDDVHDLIPQESYVLVLNRHEYEADEELMAVDARGNASSSEALGNTNTNIPMTETVGANNETSLELLAKWISMARRILVVSGAGVSVSAGIPDFRTKGSGLVRTSQGYAANLKIVKLLFQTR
mmetsp:Transcript_9250/g.17634  ORF Transcript_9250/g.17634 Transcript_9250/m.17634 type:complete len:214 (-) Transcript_9250:851-1492(-)